LCIGHTVAQYRAKSILEILIILIPQSPFSSVYIRFDDFHLIHDPFSIPLIDRSRDDDVLENIGDLKNVIKENILKKDDWGNVYKELRIDKDLKDPSRLSLDKMRIYRPYIEKERKYEECKVGERILDIINNIYNYNKSSTINSNNFESYPLLFRVSFGNKPKGKIFISIFRDYSRGNNLIFESEIRRYY
jgi:hypothetical protein